MTATIFCPQCDALLLDAVACTACGWRRPGAETELGAVAWRVETGRTLARPCALAAAGERVFAVAEDGTLFALALADGAVVLSRPPAEAGVTLALAPAGRLLLASAVDMRAIPGGGRPLLALDPASLEPVWSHPTAAHSLSAAAIEGDSIYITTSDGQIVALDAGDGRRRWAAPHPAWGLAAPAVAGGVVCAGGQGAELAAYRAADGAALWRFRGGGWFVDPLCAGGGMVFARCWDRALYAIELETGRQRWVFRGERGGGLTSPPAVAGDRVFVASRVYRDGPAERADGYAVLALRASDGAELWRRHTERHVFAAPLAAGDALLFGGEDGCICALDASSGAELWRAYAGDHVVTPPAISSDLACFGERHGGVCAVRWRPGPRALLAAASYADRGQPEPAAAAYALTGELAAAAEIYERDLGQPAHAAALFERAGLQERAGALWERAGDLHRARDCYQAAGARAALARVLEQAGEPLAAARQHEDLGSIEDAARLYAQAGDRVRAAELYDRAGRYAEAQQIWDTLGVWERSANDLAASGRRAEAAAVLAEHGQLERAAGLYEQAGELDRALDLRERLEHWERALALAAQLGADEREARAAERLGQAQHAAAAYERAAARLDAAEQRDEEQVAGLYERAAQLFADVGADVRAQACRGHVARLRRVPELAITAAEDEFVEHEWRTLRLRVENVGHGPARHVRLVLSGAFDTQELQEIDAVAAQQAVSRHAFIRPHRDQYGPEVPLTIGVAYADAHGERHERSVALAVHVVPQGGERSPVTPLSVRTMESQLRDVLTHNFRVDELELLCADVRDSLRAAGVEEELDLELVGGEGRAAQVLNLVEYLRRRGQLGHLAAAVRRARPGLL